MINNCEYVKLLQSLSTTSTNIIGYTEQELKQIEKLYDITIQGQFREFMLLAGRCDGGLLGDDPIILYRQSWGVRAQLLFQIGLFSDLQDAGAYEFMGKYGKVFCFSLEYETQYYYLITDHTDNLVYHYNEGLESVECTNLTFYEYLDKIYKQYTKDSSRNQIICKGELLKIHV